MLRFRPIHTGHGASNAVKLSNRIWSRIFIFRQGCEIGRAAINKTSGVIWRGDKMSERDDARLAMDLAEQTRGLRQMTRLRVPFALTALAICQGFCTIVFAVDILADIRAGVRAFVHILPEFAATLGLVIGVIFEVHWGVSLIRRQESMKRSLSAAAGGLSDLMTSYFRQWALTSAEADVATFTIKGFSIGEVAMLRGCAEGTIKSHLNAIYRKAGVQGRGQLVSILVEDLLNAPLLAEDNPASAVPVSHPPRSAPL